MGGQSKTTAYVMGLLKQLPLQVLSRASWLKMCVQEQRYVAGPMEGRGPGTRVVCVGLS